MIPYVIGGSGDLKNYENSLSFLSHQSGYEKVSYDMRQGNEYTLKTEGGSGCKSW